MTILFDSTRPAKSNRRFGLRLSRPTDAYGNPLRRVGYSAADAAWHASQGGDFHALDTDTASILWERAANDAEADYRVESLGYL
ncbi:hypothetical protein [Tautonia plasticadhaerens]|uniref:Uncharacterized protein n=1 Tax=Tautonia plasticadhaerens TaxID=2527974 RepID=A0A518H0P0_9BACT|nr:hypothetical protein [Tautonia plasticadhaerens]QDV34415.1 hypothetical protein ElP_23010 [Tautonia plasticadhaerens]